LGVTYFKLGDFRRAIAHLEKSERVRPSKDSSFGRYNAYYLGFSYMNLGDYRAAIAHFEEYLRFRPADAYVEEVIDWCHEQLNLTGKTYRDQIAGALSVPFRERRANLIYGAQSEPVIP